MNFLYVGTGVLLFLAAAAGVVGYFKANVSKSTIELYKEDNEALRSRLKTLEEQVAADAAKIKALESTRAYLTSVITQAEAMRAVKEVVDRIAAKVNA